MCFVAVWVSVNISLLAILKKLCNTVDLLFLQTLPNDVGFSKYQFENLTKLTFEPTYSDKETAEVSFWLSA